MATKISIKIPRLSSVLTLIACEASAPCRQAGSIAAEFDLWDGRTVRGSYDHVAGAPDLDVPYPCGDWDAWVKQLIPFVTKLVEENVPFTVSMGTQDEAKRLRWEIVS